MYYSHLKQVFSDDWCHDVLNNANQMGFEKAAVNNYGKLERLEHIRNNDKVQWHDKPLSIQVEQAIRIKTENTFPFVIDTMPYDHMGDFFRIYRYEPGQYFKPHRDGHVSIKNSHTGIDTESQVTALIYLNTPEGGETILMPKGFAMKDWWIEIRPEAGDVLLFEHDFWHEGRPVTSGEKYVLRTDLFYVQNENQ